MRDRAAGSPILKGAVYGAAAAGLSYLGIKHFSRAGLKGFYKTFERDLSHLIGLRRSRKASRFLSGKVDSARSALGLTGVDVLHHDLAEDLRTAERIFSARSGWTGNREAVIHGLLERWSGPGAHAGPLPDEIQRLTKMPVFRQVVERMGLSPDVVAARVASGGMGAKYRTIGELTRASVHAIRVPFLPFAVRPFELLTPTDLLSRGPGLGLLDPRNIAKEPNAIGALFSAGTLYPVHSLTVGKQTFRSIGRVAAGEGYHIGSARSGMGVGAMARMGITGARPLEDILEKYPHLGEPVKGGAVLGALKGLSPGNKMTRAALEIGERYGIGPQYSRVPLGGKLREIYEGFKRAATHKSIEYNLTDAQVWSEWPEISLLKRGLGKLRLSKKGAVQGAKDLSIAERMMLKLGIEPKRAVLKTGPLGEFIQKVPAARFKSTTGEFMSGLDRFTQRSPHSKYAFKSARQGLSDWFNYHLNRPSWLLNEMTGLGLRPGKTPLESLWKISTRVALPAYFGWQALQYAEYKSRKYFGYGPISGAAMVYTKGRLAAQHMLDATGITATAESLEERFPGLIDSPLAKAGVMVGAVAAGGTLGRISAGAKGGAVGLAAGLTAGLLYATGITTPADKLREMYQGERDVPVRAGRGWALGRCVHPDTPISIGLNSLKKASDVEIGDLVITAGGNLSEVTQLFSRTLGADEEMYDIRTAFNRAVPTLVTGQHPLLRAKMEPCRLTHLYNVCRPDYDSVYCRRGNCRRETGTEWVAAGDVHVGDWLAFPIMEVGESTTLAGREVTPEIAWLIGHYLAEGNVHRVVRGKAYGLEMSCSAKELEPSTHRWAWAPGIVSIKQRIRTKEKGTSNYVRVFGVRFCDWIYQALGTGSTKHFSEELMRLKPNLLFHVIQGYFYGDGHWDKSVGAITSARLEYLLAVQRTLSLFHIATTITSHNGVLDGKAFIGYRLYIPSKATQFFDKEETSPKTNIRNKAHKFVFIHSGYIFSKVTKKEIVEYKGKVLDFEVREGSSFCGASFVLHNSPFAGGRIKYEKRHWFAEMMSNYRDKARYGSSREAWRGSWLPVPENWFTLKNIMDPYYISRLHHHDRPYPTTSALFQEAPIVGPMLSATIGRLMKPVVHRAPSASGVSPEVAAGQREAEAIGLGQAPIAAPRPVLKWRLDAMTANTIHNLFQWTGLPGFMVGAMKEQATGSPGFLAHQQILADTGEITSTVNSYYDRELGGGLGSTELLRRFIPKRRGHAMYNPLQNVAPSWLPGSRSVFPEDREGYIDFHSGDPFSRIAKGEARLPGPGYEALHQLHSGKPGVYDELERLKILADVAPASQAFKQYKQVVQSQINRGELSSMDAKQFHRAIDKMEERFESRVSTYGNRYRTGAFATGEMTVAGVMSPTTFTTREMPEMMFRLAGVKETDLASGGQAAGALNATMRGLIGQRVSMTWGGQGRVMPAIVEGVNRTAIEGGLERDRLSDLGYRAKHGSGFLEQAWEAVTHLQMPGPLDYPRVKWLGVRSPLEEYQQFQLHGTADTDWKHPVKNYLIPWAASTFRFQTPESSHAREASEYLDKFQYAKYRRLAVRAEDAGRMDMASEYRRRAGATAVALDINQPSFWSDVYRAMPRPERPYFKVFAGTTSEQERERIIESVPDYMRDIYMGVWKRSTPGNTFDSPVLSHYGEVARRASRISPDEKVAEFFASHPTPPKDYMAWHPGIDLESVTVKTAANEGINIHQLGLWESQALRSERMFPQLAPLDVRGRPDLDRRDELLNEMSRAGVNDLDWSPSQRDDGSMRVTLKKRRRGFLGSLFEPLEMAW